MASTITLAAYSIRLKDREEREYLPVRSFLGHDFLETLGSYLSDRTTEPGQQEDQERIIQVTQHQIDDTTIKGLFEAGDYGFGADLRNRITGNLSYTRTVDDAELLPFYFLFWLPTDGTTAIALFQRFRQYGARSAFWFDFNEYFPYLEAIGLELNPLIHSGLLQRVLSDADLRRVRFIRHTLSSDVTEHLFAEQTVDEAEGHMELVVAANRGLKLPWIESIRDFLNGGGELSSLIELPNFDYNTIKVELHAGGGTRTIDLARPSVIRSYYDITTEVEFDDARHSTFDSVDKAATKLLAELKEDLGILE